MRTRNLVRNTMLSIVLVIVVVLRLMLWPVRLLNKGLRLSANWTLAQWRT